MVKVFTHLHRYNDPPQTVLLAFYLRYPNPYASHVLTCDVLSRDIDPITGTLRTTRLILKKGIVPRWARSWLEGFGGAGFAGGLEAWVLEESEVTHDGLEVSLKSTTKNISHARLMQIIEGTDLSSASPQKGTYHHTTAAVHSEFGGDTTFSSLVRGRIESYGAARFGVNAEKAREGMSLILNLLRSSRPLPNTSEAGSTSSSFSDLLRGRGRHLFSSDEESGSGSGSGDAGDHGEDEGAGGRSDDPSNTPHDATTGQSGPSYSSNPPSFFSSMNPELNRPSTSRPSSSTQASSSTYPSSSPAPNSFFLSTRVPNTFDPSQAGTKTSKWRDEKLMSIRQREKSRAMEDQVGTNDVGMMEGNDSSREDGGTERLLCGLGMLGSGAGLGLGPRARTFRSGTISRLLVTRGLAMSFRSSSRILGQTPLVLAASRSSPLRLHRSDHNSRRPLSSSPLRRDLDRELHELLNRPPGYRPPQQAVPASSTWALPGATPSNSTKGKDSGRTAGAGQRGGKKDLPSYALASGRTQGGSKPQAAKQALRAPGSTSFRDMVRQTKAGVGAGAGSGGQRSGLVKDGRQARPGMDAATRTGRGQPRGVKHENGGRRPGPPLEQIEGSAWSDHRETQDQREDPDAQSNSDSLDLDAPVDGPSGDVAGHHTRNRAGKIDPRSGAIGKRRKDSRGSLVSAGPGNASSEKFADTTAGQFTSKADFQKKKVKRVDTDVKVEKEVFLPLSIRVADLARLLDVKLFKLQRKMEDLGLTEQDCHPDNQITSDFSSLIAQEYGLSPVFDEERSFDLFPDPPAKDHTSLPSRPPVVTIMGHVDHGKTTLLDSLRHTAVAAGEAGGITQHIGAFSVSLKTMLEGSTSESKTDATITFLDTPGHAAFSAMRARGAHVTDIVVLVVAADDGVMPQTKEVINLVQTEGDHVGLVVAINKIDKPGIDLAKVKSALGAEGILLEEDGGDVPSVRVSGLTGTGLVDLVETLATVAEVRDLRASTDTKAEGYVLESRIEKGRGNVATVLVSRGTLKQGSSIVAGHTWCRVRQMTDDKGRAVKRAGPGMPVIVTGWRELPTAGDELLEAPNGEEEAKKAVANRVRDQERKALMKDVEQINEKRRIERVRLEAEEQAKAGADVSSLGPALNATAMPACESPPDFKELRLIIRADVSGTVEAVVGALEGIGNKEAGVKIIHTGVGDVCEADVAMADAVDGTVIGFSVSASRKVRERAGAARVDLEVEDVIYRLIETVRAKVAALLPPVIETRVLGEAVVQQIFKIDIKGKEPATIAGCRVGNGAIGKNDTIRVLRGPDREVVHEGTLDSLKHVKKDVLEAKKGSECGLSLAGWTGILEGDIVVAVQQLERARVL